MWDNDRIHNKNLLHMKFLTLLASCLLISSCGSNKVLSPDESAGAQLVLSHGGGFTGKYNTYYLLENGQLWKAGETIGVSDEVKSLSKDVATQIFSNYEILGLADVQVETYGNLLYSITMKKDGESHKISWEKGDAGSESLQLFYGNVMNQIKINNDADFKPKKQEINAKF